MIFNCTGVSLNVSVWADQENLRARETIEKELGPMSSLAAGTPIGTPEARATFKDKTGEKAGTLSHNEVLEKWNQTAKTGLERIIDAVQPAFFCLQEYYDIPRSNRNSTAVKIILIARGYAILGQQDVAVAYKTSDYTPVGTEKKTFNPDDNPITNKGFRTFPALFVDLKHNQTGTIIRVASDHVRGFNGTQQKEATKERKERNEIRRFPADPKDRFEYFLSQLGVCGAAPGDAALALSLSIIEKVKIPYSPTDLLGRLGAIFSRFFLKKSPEKSPDLIVYGLDANATAKHRSLPKLERLHPKRMRLFENYGYKFDQNNTLATIIDANDFCERKYDCLLTKETSSAATVSIEDKPIEGITNPEALDSPSTLMSDHLPVISSITYHRPLSLTERLFRWIGISK